MNETPKWKFVWPYLIFIITIVFMVITDTGIINSAIKEHKTYARTINLAGRQRMLSQKIVNDLLFVLTNGSHQKELNDELTVWNNMHHSLQHGGDSNGLMNLKNTSVINLFQELDPIQLKLYTTVKQLADSVNTKAKLPGANAFTIISTIVPLQQDYLKRMDKIVFATDGYVEKELTSATNGQRLTAIFSGIILLLEIMLIVYPYHKKGAAAYEKIKQQNAEIEDQKEEIVQQMNMLSLQNSELNSLQEIQKLTLDGINAGVWEWDIITGAQKWSGNFYHLLGYADQELLPGYELFVDQLLHPDEKPKLEEAITNHLNAGSPYQLNVRLLQKNGTYRWYETSGRAERDADHNAVRMAGSIIDINDKVMYAKQLEISNSTKDKLLAILSHDVRTPIATLQSLFDLQQEDYISEQDFMESLQKIKTLVANLSGSLDNILVWALSQMDGFNTNPQNTNVAEVLTLVSNLLIGTANEKEITIRSGLNDTNFVFIDKNHLFLIIRNLISNAIKFTPAGGEINITSVYKGDVLHLKITDTGRGMKPDQIEKLLANNQILSTPGTNGEKGSGLGLSITFDMLKQNNCNMDIESKLNCGTSFTLSIPCSKRVGNEEINDCQQASSVAIIASN